ncbi:MAG: 5'/3'-nucleotidase SurE [Armatimonadetes bacterium]|nr:5'/3'-nucleotidase SurE [Armatimonadota bacterium]
MILLTNDDGVHAEGILALREAVEHLGKVVVCAPDRPRSATGHAITLHKPLRVAEVRMANGMTAYATSGTPSDCVMMAFVHLLGRTPDLVLSGINDGPNMGWDLTYSGTASAAMEGAIYGASSVALSLVSTTGLKDHDFRPAARFAADLSELILNDPLPPGRFLNVNVPQTPEGHIAGVRITRQGVRRYPGSVEERVDPWGRKYYWLGGELPEDQLLPGTDVEALAHGFISVTPIQMDMTDYPLQGEMGARDDYGDLVQKWLPRGGEEVTEREEEELRKAISSQQGDEEILGG